MMKHIVLTVLLISIVGIAGADMITALPIGDVTADTDGLATLTYGGVTYDASSMLVYGTTTRYYAVSDGAGGDSGDRLPVPNNDDGTWDMAGAYTMPNSSSIKVGDFGSKADNFLWAGPDISSIDGLPYMECLFDTPTNVIFYFERGTGWDQGSIYGMTNGVAGDAIALTSDAYTGGEISHAGGMVRGYIVSFDQAVDGIRIAAPGADAFTIATIPEPCSMALLGLGGLALLRRRRG